MALVPIINEVTTNFEGTPYGKGGSSGTPVFSAKTSDGKIVRGVTGAGDSYIVPASQTTDALQNEVYLVCRDSGAAIDPHAGKFEHRVVFRVSPDITEAHSTNYTEIADIRQPSALLIYIGTQSSTFQINAKFVSRSKKEASENFRHLNYLKSWTKPYKDRGGGIFDDNSPPVLQLYGYGENLFKGIPVVITSLNIEYPSSVTYIESYTGEYYLPIVHSVSISLKESHNRDEIWETFDLLDYKMGTLDRW